MKRQIRNLSTAVRTTVVTAIHLMMVAAPFTAVAATLTVDCDAGGKLQTALNAAVSGDTILVLGTCIENVNVRDELTRVTVDGQGTATIRATDAAATAFQVLGRNITIRRFTISGGRSGIAVLRGGSALIDSNIVHGSGTGIIVHQNGHARIVNNTVHHNAIGGITIQESSIARVGYLDNADPVFGNVIQHNTGPGVNVQRGSAATVIGNTISENGGPGVQVNAGSHADLAGNRIDANGSDGVVVTLNSDVQLGDQPGIFEAANETSVPNVGFGLRCSLNSTPTGDLGTLTGLNGATKLDSGCSNGPKIR